MTVIGSDTPVIVRSGVGYLATMDELTDYMQAALDFYTDALARAAIHGVPAEFSGTAYVTALADAFGYRRLNNANPITMTIAPQADVNWVDGAVMSFEQAGAGQVTVVPGAGVQIFSRTGALKTAGQYAVGQVKRIGVNQWVAIGDLTV
jgi:hypothetical protein